MRKPVLESVCATALFMVTVVGLTGTWHRRTVHQRFLTALRYEDAPTVAWCVREGENVNQRGNDGTTPLMVAVRSADTALVREFIRRGADVTAHSSTGGSASLAAAAVPRLETLSILADAGADIHIGESDRSAVWCAAWYGNDRNITWLIQHGLRAEAPGAHGWTPLMYAVYRGNVKAAAALLAAGANPNASEGLPLYMADQRHMREMAHLLKQYGAHYPPRYPH